ncbi:ABC transporter ATP-binding protein [Candidatus Spongiihabitans sp.]|uniref:ABC transporter ATP-binding protein n=1 Tax=Candidatus Spongiihabitans sp. TaxID=3101308 RepID=UPI003C6F2B11
MKSVKTNSDHIVAQAIGVGKTVQLASDTLDILQDISLEITTGRTVAISGASGSGKTTLLGLLAGLDQPTSGYLTLMGQTLNNLNEDQRAKLRRGRVGFVFQSFHLLPNLTAVENVALALEVIPESTAIVENSRQALSRVGLSERCGHLPSQMSGGEQQRVALARSMVVAPAILFADEPTGNLDHATSSQIADLMFSLCKDNGSTLVLVTHNRALAARCDDQYRIEAGRLV